MNNLKFNDFFTNDKFIGPTDFLQTTKSLHLPLRGKDGQLCKLVYLSMYVHCTVYSIITVAYATTLSHF